MTKIENTEVQVKTEAEIHSDTCLAEYETHMNTVKALLREVRKGIGESFEADDVVRVNSLKSVARDAQQLVNKLVNVYFDSALDTIRLLEGNDKLAGVERIHGKRGKPAVEVDPFA